MNRRSGTKRSDPDNQFIPKLPGFMTYTGEMCFMTGIMCGIKIDGIRPKYVKYLELTRGYERIQGSSE